MFAENGYHRYQVSKIAKAAGVADGTIYLIGSRMNFAACNETWIREGNAWPP